LQGDLVVSRETASRHFMAFELCRVAIEAFA
jgi:hypothetical protein